MASYETLGVRRVVNAAGFNSRFGSACISPEVLHAMNEAAGCFVDMHELQARGGEVIARIVGAESAMVTSGSAGAMLVAAAACITRGDRAMSLEMPGAAGGAEVIVQKGQRTGYDQAITTAGAHLVEVGLPYRVYPEQIERAIGPNTVALLFTIGELVTRGEIVPLETVVAIGKAHGLPVILDAAVANYPLSRLRYFASIGVDLTATSGGKHIGGPPGTGLLFGSHDLISWCLQEAGPEYGIGRPLKVGKEEIVGLLTALELYAQRDEEVEHQRWENMACGMAEQLRELPHVRTSVLSTDGAGRPVPRTLIRLDEQSLGLTAVEASARLRRQDPPIAVASFHLHEGALLLNPATLQEGDIDLIITGFQKLWAELNS